MEPKPGWVEALRAIDDKSFLRFNHTVGRWEFGLSHADGIVRSQFWCDFRGERDSESGLYPYRELTDDTMREALFNLQKTFVGNPYDGNGTVQREVGRRYFYNKYLQEQRWKERGEEYAEFIWDNRRRIRDAGTGPVSGWTPEKEKALKDKQRIMVVER